MTTRRRYTVTLPDGQGTDVRTSDRKVYTFAVLASDEAAVLAAEADTEAAGCRRHAHRIQAALDFWQPSETRTDWGGGRTYVEVYLAVPGSSRPVFGGSWLEPTDTPKTPEQIRATLARQAADLLDRAAMHDRRAQALREGPEVLHGVVRWSQTWEAAERATRSRELGAGRPGRVLSVWPVDPS